MHEAVLIPFFDSLVLLFLIITGLPVSSIVATDENVVPIPKKKKKKKKEKRDVKEPTVEINVKVDTDTDKKELTIKDFKVGTNVEWKKNNKTFTGVVTEVNPKKKNSVNVVDNQSGKEQYIKINTLKIIE